MDSVDDFYQPTPKESEVWKVCDSLYAEKKRLTYQSIGERLLSLGLKRGSNTDICRYLASWKKHHYPIVIAKRKQPVSQPWTPPTQASEANRSFGALEQTLKNIEFEQKRLSMQWQQWASQKKPLDQDGSSWTGLLVEMIQKQQQREAHYLKALDHARVIQDLLKSEIERYRKQLIQLDLV